MYQTMAIANYEDRFVIPSSHKKMVEEASSKKAVVFLRLAMVAQVAPPMVLCLVRSRRVV